MVAKFGQIAKLICAAMLAGLLVGGILLPAVGPVGLAAKNASEQARAQRLDEPPLPQRSTILAADGSKIASFYYENRTDVTIDKIAPVMQKAVVSIEDARFYQHGALDLKGTIRALVRDQSQSAQKQGGSSLTQQYVKNVLYETAGARVAQAQDRLSKARTKSAKHQAQAALDAAKVVQGSTIAPNLTRKLQELRYALWVEEHYSKNDILDKYLNIAYFGHFAYGIEAASQRYFGVHAANLSTTQAATLAGMVNNANKYDPTKYPGVVLERRNIVLDRMVQLGHLGKPEATAAKAKPLGLRPKILPGGCDISRYAYFCLYVQNEILTNPVFGATQDARRSLLNTGGLTIQTSLDPKAQDASQRAVDNNSGVRSSRITMEAMVQPGTGKIQGIAVSRKYGLDKHEASIDYAVDIAHGGGGGVAAGSTFKVFTLAAALENGVRLNETINSPSSTSVTGYTDCSGNSLSWPSVSNAGESESGAYSLETGTWASVNTYYALLEKRVGLCKVARMAASFGMTRTDGSPLHQVASMTLGSNEIDIVHQAAAYAGFAASGKYCKPIAINGITDSTGKQLNVPGADCKQAVKADTANEISKILKGVLTRGTAAGNSLPDGRPAAGKTGTNENLTSVMFAGYTTNLAAVLWYGNPDAPFGDPVNAYGASLAPYWVQSMVDALSGTPITDFPDPGNVFGVSPPPPAKPGKKSTSKTGKPGGPGGGKGPKKGGPKH
ncbi:MAG: glycosyl transferase family 51 [Streptosporangiaceae bacterium]|jgi:membrane peptidoglycan carboxypeptidase|nr:glycosyl transferase family 51 [Streptosporangiaceae bacterium]